jgi:hypothetical protein
MRAFSSKVGMAVTGTRFIQHGDWQIPEVINLKCSCGGMFRYDSKGYRVCDCCGTVL